MQGSRICPQCRRRGEGRVCPADGFATVTASLYDAPESSVLVGREFDGRYRVEAFIGRGGMGAVYKATQLSVERSVALKILPREFASNLERVRRFQAEARASSRLDHPNTIRVYDFGQTEDGDLYLVTELLEGETLGELIAREAPLDAARAVAIACQVLKSLAEAHDHGIVHRDMKPENIFLRRVRGEGDFVKVLDFGIAKIVGLDTAPSNLTKEGTVVGTPAYMSPEQARGHAVAPQSDLYSLAVILYEMLTGRGPFDSDTPMGLMMDHVQTPPRELPDGHAPGLAAVLRRCLAKDAAARPISADAMRDELEACFRPGALPAARMSSQGLAVPQERLTAALDAPTRLGVGPLDTISRAAALSHSDVIALGVHPSRWRYVALFAALLLGGGGVAFAIWPKQSVPELSIPREDAGAVVALRPPARSDATPAVPKPEEPPVPAPRLPRQPPEDSTPEPRRALSLDLPPAMPAVVKRKKPRARDLLDERLGKD